MAQHNTLGKKGEDVAAKFLADNGYTILERNWVGERHEIDIIASVNGFIVFVEVKTRSSAQWGNPENAVSEPKIKRMVAAAHHYLQTNETDLQVRFDVIAIITNKRQTEITHIEDAFLPPLNG